MILHHSSKSFLLKTSRSGSASLLHSPLLRRQRRRFDDELHHARLATSSYSSYAIPKSQCLWLPGEEKQGPWDLTKWATSVMNGLDEDGKKAKLREIRERETTQKLRHPPSQCGVYFQDSTVDELYMVNENTKNSNLAAGLRAYDHLLQTLARLHQEEDYDTMAEMLKSYQREKYSRDRCGATLSILDEGSMIEDGSLVGVKSPDRLEDIEWLARNYPSYALAKGIRIRSERIQFCAELLKRKDFEQLKMVLKPFERECILRKRYMDHRIDWGEPIDRNKRTLMRKVLTAVPRRVSFAHQQRSAVVVPICLAYGVPCLLFQVRSMYIKFPGDVCFPGGKTEYKTDPSIITTGFREMEEEIRGLPKDIEAIAALRCPWEELQAFSCDYWAVTPIVGWIGEIGGSELYPSPDETAELFTVPLTYLLDDNLWIRDHHRRAPIFCGGAKRDLWYNWLHSRPVRPNCDEAFAENVVPTVPSSYFIAIS